ncbi:protein EURL homolog [Takifugu flavidus]|uniref:protein EURL homolog n=1 Tax=Takifugu flavidus TaxID=433684 RepID=UPI00254403B8|nr:protein EURL homolog [Takifugu flavidus]XP_056911019.1 protein EURL homolog [Takifugu flavidus]
MEEEEQFENIDLNDDNICSVCKLETETGTLSFCHVCFELNLEGVSAAALLHSRSLRGHRDCFEKCHVIANQKLSCSRGGRSTYQGLKLAVSQRLNQIIQYTQNSVSLGGPSRQAANQHCSSQQGNKLPPQAGSQVPRYTRCWELSNAAAPPAYAGHTGKELGLLPEPPSEAWPSGGVGGAQRRKQSTPGNKADRRTWPNPSREELCAMSLEEVHQVRAQLLLQTQKVFEELTEAVQEKDSLLSELHVRHIAIEQLFKNCAKLPWLHISRAGVKASSRGGDGEGGAAAVLQRSGLT